MQTQNQGKLQPMIIFKLLNSKGNLNHRTRGLAHEFAHVVLYLRGLPYGHTQPGVDTFINEHVLNTVTRLGYDF